MLSVLFTVLALIPILIFLIPTVLGPSTKIVRLLRRWRYQYEVTFALNMLTDTEKFIFDSVLFLGVSLIVIGTILYLPEHLSIISGRALYYFYGSPLYLIPSSAAHSFSSSTFRSSLSDAIYNAAKSNATFTDKLVACGTNVKAAFTNSAPPAYQAVRQYVNEIVGAGSAGDAPAAASASTVAAAASAHVPEAAGAAAVVVDSIPKIPVDV